MARSSRSCVHDYVDTLVYTRDLFFFLEGGGGAPILYGNYEFVWIMYAKIGVGGSTSDKSGVPEVDSCAAQMSLNNIQGHSYNLHVSNQIIN